MTATFLPATEQFIALDEEWSTHNYHPLPVVISHGEGAWVTDVEGRRYLDFLSGYSSLNFGHRHPDLVAAAVEQLGRVTLTSRAFHHDQFGAFCRELAELTGTDLVLAMNSGAEAVESAIKVARKWAYRVKGVPAGEAEIVVAGSNFHGRTTTIVSFSTDDTARDDFGPFTPGFRVVRYGSLDDLRAAVTDRTAAVLLEPVQGEAGVVVPPAGYLRGVRELCDERGVLMIADEIQSGLGRTGELFALDHEGVRADLYTLGKALGGGILPVSAVVGSRDVLGVLRPGEHGSTFGATLACAVGRAVVRLLATGEYQRRSRELGAHLHARLGELVGHGVAEVRGRGLWAGVEIAPGGPRGREASEALAGLGVLCKETQDTTLRVAPPLMISHEDLDRGIDAIGQVLRARG
ncbi:ornithine--oxo-acid transaminase [Saccharothrix sp. MB29]|nr:ornithine--oxo-acid transaminase [Saccharothrix sp. MB29]